MQQQQQQLVVVHQHCIHSIMKNYGCPLKLFRVWTLLGCPTKRKRPACFN